MEDLVPLPVSGITHSLAHGEARTVAHQALSGPQVHIYTKVYAPHLSTCALSGSVNLELTRHALA